MPDLSNQTMLHIKKGNIEYLQFRELLKYQDKLQHCYTLKGNGNNYETNTQENYKTLYEALNLDYEGFTKIGYQAHGNLVEQVNEKNETHTNIDGLITNQKGISLSLRFADCTPILFYDKEKNIIGNIHSGWKGTLQKIGQKGAQKMIETYGCQKQDLLCFLGPCIGMCHFEVGEDVKEQFESTFSYLGESEKWLKKGEKKEQEQKYFIDTTWINRKFLEEIGIDASNIIESKICTVCHKEQMHSYRAEREKAGRNTAIIGLK